MAILALAITVSQLQLNVAMGTLDQRGRRIQALSNVAGARRSLSQN